MDNMNPIGNGLNFPHFRPLNFRDYRNYLPTAYDDSLSMQESLLQVLNFCNEIGLLNQNMSDNWNMLLGWIKINGIDDAVSAQLNTWVADGTMAKVLDKTVLNKINKEMEDLLADYPKQLQAAKDFFSSTADAFKKDVNSTLNGQNNQIQRNYDSLMQQLSTISTGVKGTYSDLSSLTSNKPNGDTGMYVTTDTGHWFFWNGKAWQDGGQFQSSGIDQTLLDKIDEAFSFANVNNFITNGSFATGKAEPAVPTNSDTNLSVTDYLGRKWLQITGVGNSDTRGAEWSIEGADKISAIQHYPLQISFDIQSSVAQTFNIDIHFIGNNGQDVSNDINIDSISLNASEIFNYQNTIDLNISSLIGVSKVVIMIFSNNTSYLGTTLLTGLKVNVAFNTNEKSNQLPQLIAGKPIPANGSVISTTNYFGQEWLKMTSTVNTQYRGLNFWISDSDKILAMATYPVKINFNIQSSIDQTLGLAVHFHDINDNDLRTINIDNIVLNASEILNYQKEFSLDSNQIKGASKVIIDLYTAGTKDLGTILINNYSAVLEYNANEKLYHLPELIDSSPIPTNGAVISTTKYLDQEWLKMTSTVNAQYRGLTFLIDNPDKILAMAAYPVKINFNIQSSIDQTLGLVVHFHDINDNDLRTINIDNIVLNASEILNYQKEFSLDSNQIKGASKVIIDLYTAGTKDLGTILINNYSAVLEYNANEKLYHLPELIDSSPIPTNGAVISTTKYLDQEWLKMTSTVNAQYRGLTFLIDNPDKILAMAAYPVKINFNIQSSIDQTLGLVVHFHDINDNDLRTINIDNIALKASEILNYQKEFSLDSNQIKDASKVIIDLFTAGTDDIGTILINNYRAVLEYKTNEMLNPIPDLNNDNDKVENYYNLPIIKITGKLTGISQNDAKQVTYMYHNGNTVLTGNATLKWQGNSSTGWVKKGYRLQLFTDNTFAKKEKVQFIARWSPTSKINLKAYYTDGLLSRDVVNANIGADIASTNFLLPNDLKQEDNFGFIDGFPIVLIFNDKFEGIYSFNMARPDFDYVKYGIMGNNYTNVTNFASANKTDVKLDGSDFESLNPEIVTEDEKSAVGDLVTWVSTSSNENFKADFEKHLDLKTTIDYFILTNLLASPDSFAKNQIFLSWDGVKWFTQAYDLDSTLGIDYAGKEQNLPTELIGTQNTLFNRLSSLFASEISARYAELRTWLTPAYMLEKYKQHINEIGLGNYKLEFEKWDNPSKDTATYKQLKDAVLHQFSLLDKIWLHK